MNAIYSRVSSKSQDTASQDMDLNKWSIDIPDVQWFTDKATGTNMNRPSMDKLLNLIRKGKITKLVVWRLDRLGRTARGLLDFFNELKQHNCGFLSLRESIDIDTASGRLLLTILAGVAEFETEVRSERQRAGIAAAREKNNGKCPWGGRKKGTRIKVTIEKEQAAKQLYNNGNGKSVSEISRIIGLSRRTIYYVLKLPDSPVSS